MFRFFRFIRFFVIMEVREVNEEMRALFEEYKLNPEEEKKFHSDKVKEFIKMTRIALEAQKKQREILSLMNEQEREEANDAISDSLKIPKYFQVRDVSQLLNVTPQMVRKHCAEGRITGHQTLEGRGKWLIDSDQFLNHPNWDNFLKTKREMKKKSKNLASKILETLEEDEV